MPVLRSFAASARVRWLYVRSIGMAFFEATLQKDEDTEAFSIFLRSIIHKTVGDICGIKMWSVFTANSVWLPLEPPSGRRPLAIHCRGGHVVLQPLLLGPEDMLKCLRRLLALYIIEFVRLLMVLALMSTDDHVKTDLGSLSPWLIGGSDIRLSFRRDRC